MDPRDALRVLAFHASQHATLGAGDAGLRASEAVADCMRSIEDALAVWDMARKGVPVAIESLALGLEFAADLIEDARDRHAERDKREIALPLEWVAKRIRRLAATARSRS